ncbi:hypothetical protein M407DRAFT_8299 [Tulasnella calospora MUT 4182]|uniref:BTB domain-containing protein n=1 Tax=Tulasnella calospora MUT 4182 TaxID=1051891 RepID=A0A0C3QGU5_9AGAM|nr:hypothetical protein M407DRAFT_8299 [Tulasnella calospora MUT 4182]
MAYTKDQILGDSTEKPEVGTDTKVIIGGREYAKHPSHWYEDGNVGFLVEGTAFLIHRGVISRKSPVIKTLVDSSSILLPDDAVPPYEQSHLTSPQGVTFVKLGVDDRAIDFSRVLDFIYPNVLPSTPAPQWSTVDVMGLVRFTNKYLIQDLKTWAVSKLESNHLLVLKDRLVTGTLKATYSNDPGFCVDIIQFSLQCQVSQFLPLAFYALATMEWSNHPPDAALCLDRLSSADRCRIIEGRSALTKAVKEKGSNMYENGLTEERCPEGKEACHDVWHELWSNPQYRWMNLLLHPLEELEFILVEAENESLCVECYTELQTETREFRGELMSRLTKFFRLE